MTVHFNDELEYVLVHNEPSPKKNSESLVQKRLETYNKTSPTKKEIEAKIQEASTNRENILSQKVQKLADAENQAKLRRQSFDRNEELKLEALALQNIQKEQLAAQLLQENISQKVTSAKTHNLKVSETSTKIIQQTTAELEALRIKTDEALKKAAENKELLTKVEIGKVISHNQLVLETKESVEKQYNDKLTELEKETNEALLKAAVNKTEFMKKEIERVTAHNSIVDLRKSSLPNMLEEERTKLNALTNSKMEMAINQHAAIIDNIKAETHNHNLKVVGAGYAALQEEEKKRHELAESTSINAQNAAIKHEEFLEKRVNHTSNTPAKKSNSPSKSPTSGSPTNAIHYSAEKEVLTKELIQQKMEDAAARREVILLQRGEQAGMEFSKAKAQGLAVLKSPLKMKREETSPKKLHNDDEALKVYDESNNASESEVCVSLDSRMGDA